MAENVHAAYDLKQMQMLPLEAKIKMSQKRIREWYEYWDGMVYVSFSGGKDSTVLLHLVRSLYPDVPAVFFDTGLEYPEIRNHVKTFDNVVWMKPEMNFRDVVTNYGYPVISKEVANTVRRAKPGTTRWQKLQGTLWDQKNNKLSLYNIPKWKFLLDAPFRMSEECCDIMKKRPSAKYEKETGRKPFIGLMASESMKRRIAWMKTGCNAFEKNRAQSQPLAFWTEQDVLEYVLCNNLGIASVYGEIVETGNQVERMDGFHNELKTTGAERTGCMFCGFGAHIEPKPNRFQRMKKTHPKIHDYCMRPLDEGGLGMREVLDFIGIEYE